MNNIHPIHKYSSLAEFEKRADELKLKKATYGDFTIFDYDQLESPRHSEADWYRGIVLDKNGKIVRATMKRFYNLGEGDIDFNFNDYRIVDKEDGSLIAAWFNKETSQWEVGTRFNPIGNNTLFKHIAFNNGVEEQTTYRELFESYFDDIDHMKFMFNALNVEYTYLFELCSPHNKVVHQYDEVKLFYLGAVCNKTGIEYIDIGIDGKPCIHTTYENMREFAETIGLDVPANKAMKHDGDDPIKTLKEMTEGLKNLREGFVIRDSNNNRYKVKSTAYLIAHRTKGHKLGYDDIVELIRIGEHHEYVAVFPEYKTLFETYSVMYTRLIENITHSFYKHGSIESQKEFALAIKDKPYKAVLFDMRKYGIKPLDALKKIKTEHIVKMLE